MNNNDIEDFEIKEEIKKAHAPDSSSLIKKKKMSSFVLVGMMAVMSANIAMGVLNQAQAASIENPTETYLVVKEDQYSKKNYDQVTLRRYYTDVNTVQVENKTVSEMDNNNSSLLKNLLPSSLHKKAFTTKYIQLVPGQREVDLSSGLKHEKGQELNFYKFQGKIQYETKAGQHVDKFVESGDINFMVNGEGKVNSFSYGKITVQKVVSDSIQKKIDEVGVDNFVKNQEALTKDIVKNTNVKFSQVGIVVKKLDFAVHKYDLSKSFSYSFSNHTQNRYANDNTKVFSYNANIKLKINQIENVDQAKLFYLDLNYALTNVVPKVMESHSNDFSSKSAQAEISKEIIKELRNEVNNTFNNKYTIEDVKFEITGVQNHKDYVEEKDGKLEQTPETFKLKSPDQVSTNIRNFRNSTDNSTKVIKDFRV